MQGETNTNIALESVVAVPYDSWHEDLIRPQRVCTRVDGECIETHYPSPPESVKVLQILTPQKYACIVYCTLKGGILSHLWD